MEQDGPIAQVSQPWPVATEPPSTPPAPGPLFRFRWALYAVVAVALMIPALWRWPAAYPWDHDSPCTIATNIAQNAEATSLFRLRLTPTPPDACVDMGTVIARRKTMVP